MKRNVTKHNAILAAARQQFLAQGFHATKIEAVARLAGVSKVTVYAHFGDKESLFVGVVEQEAASVKKSLESVQVLAPSLRERLCALGVGLLEFSLQADILALERLLGALSETHPELVRQFYEVGPRAGMRRIEEEFEPYTSQAAAWAADLFALWRGSLYFEVSLGVRNEPTRAEIVAHVTHGVERVLKMLEVEHSEE